MPLKNNTKVRASASAAPQAAAIHNEESPTTGEVSDAIDNDTTVVDNNTSDDEDNDDTSNSNGGDDTVFFCAARDIMNRVGRMVGTAAREDCRFREHFGGAPFTIVQMVWDMLVAGRLLPKKGEPKHLLWTLYSLKCYPKEGPGCAAIGALKGAIDPKTMRMWVWLFLEHINKLADHVVSLFFL